MARTTTLGTRLRLSFALATLLPLLVAIAVAVPWFRNSSNAEAQRSLDVHAQVATQSLRERMAVRRDEVVTIARAFADAEPTEEGMSTELRRQAVSFEGGYLLWVNGSGRVTSSLDTQRHVLRWPGLEKAVRSSAATVTTSIIPQAELEALGLASINELELKVTDQGSADPSEAQGALAVVAVAPVTHANGMSGAIVAIEPLKLNNDFVDSITRKLGGVATVFQNGVRVSTTVRDKTGGRAIGTAVSSKVRTAVLDGGKPFRGEAFVVSRDYFTAYDPLRDFDGNVVGMLFVGIDETPYAAATFRFGLAMAFVGIFALIAGILQGFFAARGITAPLARVSEAAERVATGDLTVVVPEEGFAEAITMGRAFNTMTTSLRRLIGHVGQSSDKLDRVSGEIASAASQEADSATSQASAVSEATATLEEINRSFGAVADGARRVLGIAEDSLAQAEEGRGAVERSAGNTERLAAGASAVRDAAADLAATAADIDQVTLVIDQIAEQTKILALNAAIEAARAGSAGKGFGVVAREIRTLAESVTTSTGRIDSLVNTIQQACRTLSKNAEGQVSVVEDSVTDSMRTRDSFDLIFDRMDRTAVAAREIATAAAQQQSAARSIVDVMQQVSQGVSATAASSRQLADSASDIEKEASGLADGLKGFRTE